MYHTVNFYYCTALPIIHIVLKNQACNIYKYWSYSKNLRVIFLVCFLSAYFTLVDSSFESNRLYLAWPSELGAGANCFPIYWPEYKQNSSPSKGLQLLTPSIPEIIWAINVRAIVVCGFLMKSLKKHILKI